MRRDVLVVGVKRSSQLAEQLLVTLWDQSLRPLFIDDWSNWNVRLFPQRREFVVASRTDELRTSHEDVCGMLLFGYPSPPSTPSCDAYYQAAEYDAFLFGLALMAAPGIASRWSYLVAGLSDVIQEIGDQNGLVPDTVVKQLVENGVRELVMFRDVAFVRSDSGTPIRISVRADTELPFPITLRFESDGRNYATLVGVLPAWAVDCEGFLHFILRDQALRKSDDFRPLKGGCPASSEHAERQLLVVAHLRDTTAVHLLHKCKQRNVGSAVIDLTELYSPGFSEERLTNAMERIRSAPLVFARPLLIRSSDSDREPAMTRHLSVLRSLQNRDLPTVNAPAAGHSNVSKVAQLTLLAQTLDVPMSMATNDPSAVLEFQLLCGKLIYKSVSWQRSIASLFDSDAMKRLELLPNCPSLFQEYVEGPNCRLHIVQDESFPVKIDSQETDFRFGESESFFEPTELPIRLIDAVSSVAKESGLLLAGCDLRMELETGTWKVLEINRMPAFDFYDHRSRGRVAESLAGLALAR